MPANRTLNPLHFEDLEPHRFEDLVRQLVYDLRPWYTIEATGRTGSDEGADIRAIERISMDDLADPGTAAPIEVPVDLPESQDGFGHGSHESSGAARWEERLWVVQCKRERSVNPARVQAIIEESLPKTSDVPYGFILAAASDFSVRARAAFRSAMLARGIQEFLLWGKGELEDLLFQPKNDHLLFAYFGISLQVRRRSARTTFGTRLATKRRLVKLLGGLRRENPEPVLLRDAAASEYPKPADPDAFRQQPRWRYFRFAGHLRPDHVAFVVREYWAWAKFDQPQIEWDAIETFDQGYPPYPELAWGPGRVFGGADDAEEQARRFWLQRVPERERMYLRIYGFVHYDRIVLIDEIGDRYHEPPHILVDCTSPDELFDGYRDVLDAATSWGEQQSIFPEDGRRVQLFPTEIPLISDEEFRAG